MTNARRPSASSTNSVLPSPRVSLFRFVPLPGTEVYERAALHGVRGTHQQPGWDGDWAKFHIHHNNERWWGNDQEWAEAERSHARLREFVESG
jgi:hypothetical protein